MYQTDYNPPGQFGESGLFAPPAQVLTLSTTISTLEGFFSLARHGLSGMSGGFGQAAFSNAMVDAGDASRSVGYLAFTSADSSTDGKIVEEISDLLTGKLSPLTREAIVTSQGILTTRIVC
jgi:hypothetical protein